MFTKTEIVNLALLRLALDPVESLSTGENHLNRHLHLCWEVALAGILQDHPWAFARRRKPLAAMADSCIGFAYAYVYPEDCARACRVISAASTFNRSDPSGAAFEIGRNIDGRHKVVLTDLPKAALEYTSSQVPYEEFPPLFVNALIWRLAAELAESVKNSGREQVAAMQSYRAKLEAAQAADNAEWSAVCTPISHMFGA